MELQPVLNVIQDVLIVQVILKTVLLVLKVINRSSNIARMPDGSTNAGKILPV